MKSPPGSDVGSFTITDAGATASVDVNRTRANWPMNPSPAPIESTSIDSIATASWSPNQSDVISSSVRGTAPAAPMDGRYTSLAEAGRRRAARTAGRRFVSGRFSGSGVQPDATTTDTVGVIAVMLPAPTDDDS